MKKILVLMCAFCIVFVQGCTNTDRNKKEHVILRIKCPPMTMAYDSDHMDAEIYDLFTEAAESFKKQYTAYDVEFQIEKYQYVDEKKKVIDKIGTDEAADILFGGSFNIPGYIAEQQLLPLDDIIDQDLRTDIDDTIWKQAQFGNSTYMLPYYTLQNTLLVNADWMRKAGLDEYIPKAGTIAQWSTEEYEKILYALKKVMKGNNEFPMFLYGANNQGDMHIMTLLRAFGSSLYDEKGSFHINTKEGRKALRWLQQLSEDEITPVGAENMDYISNLNLFYSGQLAICVGNLVNIRDAQDVHGMDLFLANSPSLDKKGYATTYLNGFIVFDNKDAARAKAAKDFIRYIYDEEELLKYARSGIPVNKSYVQKHGKQLDYITMYQKNEHNVVNNLNEKPNWEGVRAVFHTYIQELLLKNRSIEEIAEAMDDSVNEAIQTGILE